MLFPWQQNLVMITGNSYFVLYIHATVQHIFLKAWNKLGQGSMGNRHVWLLNISVCLLVTGESPNLWAFHREGHGLQFSGCSPENLPQVLSTSMDKVLHCKVSIHLCCKINHFEQLRNLGNSSTTKSICSRHLSSAADPLWEINCKIRNQLSGIAEFHFCQYL